MALKLIYQMFAKLLSWIMLCVRSDTANEIEILVLRHQLAVLQRRTPQPQLNWSDRAVIAALARLFPTRHRRAFLITQCVSTAQAAWRFRRPCTCTYLGIHETVCHVRDDRRISPEPVTVRPQARPHLAALGMAFTDVAFVHWPYPPHQLEPLLPPDVTPDTFDGTGYVGLVAFRMRSYGEFLEFNVRTYSVDRRGRRGVVFLTMEADRLPWVLAARAARLPYRWSRMSLTRDLHEIDYRSRRRWPGPIGTGTHIRLRVGPPIPGSPLEHFLTARWRLHHRVTATTVIAQLAHNPWPLHAAELLGLHDNLLAATGVATPTGPPASVLYSPGVRGRMGLPPSHRA